MSEITDVAALRWMRDSEVFAEIERLTAALSTVTAQRDRLSQGVVMAHMHLAERLDDADTLWLMDVLMDLHAGKSAQEAAAEARHREPAQQGAGDVPI